MLAKVMLFTAAVVLATSPASGACAWLLWQQLAAADAQGEIRIPLQRMFGRYEILRAFQNQAACERARSDAVSTRPEVSNLVVCLPDTVDPRESKK